MIGLQQAQDILERILGGGPLPNHGAFWRGKTRNELVALEVYGLRIIVEGRPDESNLIRALRGQSPFGADLQPPPAGAVLPRMPLRRPPAQEVDIALLEEWIHGGCPETASPIKAMAARTTSTLATDDTHVRYWRSIDDFFLPGLASPETVPHVNRMHVKAFLEWKESLTGDDARWATYLAQPDVAASFQYIRHHQRRFILEFYEGSKPSIFDSLWKFGGNLLPADPQSNARPEHTMNGLLDWFFWCPYLDASLRAGDMNPVDLELARAWQLGIVADGLLRTDADRPLGGRMPITDYVAGDPDLRAKVEAKYTGADAATLRNEMARRAREAQLF